MRSATNAPRGRWQKGAFRGHGSTEQRRTVIDRALTLLTAQLDEALRQRFGSNDAVAVLGPVPDTARDPTTIPAQPVTLTLVRVEEDRTTRTQVTTRRRTDDALEEIQPDVKLHLYLLVTAAARDYGDSLHYLSAAVGYFQSKPNFDRANTPALDAGIEKLVLELSTQSFEEQNNLWGTLAVRYLPSVLYRVRLVAIQESAAARIVQPIAAVNLTQVSRS
jgi:hypothetical protein